MAASGHDECKPQLFDRSGFGPVYKITHRSGSSRRHWTRCVELRASRGSQAAMCMQFVQITNLGAGRHWRNIIIAVCFTYRKSSSGEREFYVKWKTLGDVSYLHSVSILSYDLINSSSNDVVHICIQLSKNVIVPLFKKKEDTTCTYMYPIVLVSAANAKS